MLGRGRQQRAGSPELWLAQGEGRCIGEQWAAQGAVRTLVTSSATAVHSMPEAS